MPSCLPISQYPAYVQTTMTYMAAACKLARGSSAACYKLYSSLQFMLYAVSVHVLKGGLRAYLLTRSKAEGRGLRGGCRTRNHSSWLSGRVCLRTCPGYTLGLLRTYTSTQISLISSVCYNMIIAFTIVSLLCVKTCVLSSTLYA